jgi:hypothetical protein
MHSKRIVIPGITVFSHNVSRQGYLQAVGTECEPASK